MRLAKAIDAVVPWFALSGLGVGLYLVAGTGWAIVACSVWLLVAEALPDDAVRSRDG